MLLAGLPIISKQETQKFRHYINTALDQHVHVAATEIPLWSELNLAENADIKRDIVAKVVSKQSTSDISLGTFLFIVRPDLQATIMTLSGECCFHVGSVQCDSKEGCVFLVHFYRNPSDLFMGGTLCLLDVFSFDGINYAEKPYSERSIICRFLHRSILLPSRFRMVASQHFVNDVKGGHLGQSASAITFTLLK